MTGPEPGAALDVPLTVTPATVASHGAKVDAVRELLSNARQAAATVSLAKDAYGWLCSGIPVVLESLQVVLIDCMDQGLLSLQDAGAQLRRSAESYQDAETQSEGRVDQLMCDTVTPISPSPQP